MSGKRGFKSNVRTAQLQVSALVFSVVSDALVEGADMFTLTKNATGDYTLTLRTPFQRSIICPAPSPETADLQPQVVSRSSSAVNFKFTNNSGTATDTNFSGVIFGSDDIVLRGI